MNMVHVTFRLVLQDTFNENTFSLKVVFRTNDSLVHHRTNAITSVK